MWEHRNESELPRLLRLPNPALAPLALRFLGSDLSKHFANITVNFDSYPHLAFVNGTNLDFFLVI